MKSAIVAEIVEQTKSKFLIYSEDLKATLGLYLLGIHDSMARTEIPTSPRSQSRALHALDSLSHARRGSIP